MEQKDQPTPNTNQSNSTPPDPTAENSTTVNPASAENNENSTPETATETESLEIVEQVEQPDGSTTTRVDTITTTDIADVPPEELNPTPETEKTAPTSPTINNPETLAPTHSPTPQLTPITPPKKKKTGLIIGLVVAAFVLIAGGIAGAVAYHLYYNSPEKVAADAIINLFTADSVSLSGDASLDLGSYGSTLGIDSVQLTLADTANLPLPNVSQLGLTVDGTHTYQLTLGEAVSKDGTIFLKLDNLATTYAQVLKDYAAEIGSANLRAFHYFDDLITEADGTWYEINIPDLLEKYGPYGDLSKSEIKSAQSLYSCAISTINTLPARAQELAEIYKSHPFVIVEDYTGSGTARHGGQLYTFDLEVGELVDFISEAIDTEFLDDIATCVDDSGLISSSTTVKKSLQEYRSDYKQRLAEVDLDEARKSLDKAMKELPEYYVEIDGSHHIVSYHTEYSESGVTASANLNLNYDQTPVQLPTSTTPVDKLVDKFLTKLSEPAF